MVSWTREIKIEMGDLPAFYAELVDVEFLSRIDHAHKSNTHKSNFDHDLRPFGHRVAVMGPWAVGLILGHFRAFFGNSYDLPPSHENPEQFLIAT
jgi:hypothetical protein